MPLDDASLWLSRRVGNGVGPVFVGPGRSQTGVALDKRLQGAAAERAGFSIPQTRLIEGGTPPGGDPGLRFPVVVKPALAASEQGGRLTLAGAAITCEDEDELARVIGRAPQGSALIAQPRLEGTGEGVFGLATSAGIRAWSAHRRIRMMNPAGSGSSACMSIPLQDSIRETAERMITGLDWSGIFMIEMLRDTEGKPWFIELNGRAWGSMALSRAASLEYPAWAVSQALGEGTDGVPESGAVSGVHARHLGREAVHLLAVLRGPPSAGVRWPSRAANRAGGPQLAPRGSRLQLASRGARGSGRRHRLDRPRSGAAQPPEREVSVKAAAHVHSDWSYDGSWSLEDIAREFRRRGYARRSDGGARSGLRRGSLGCLSRGLQGSQRPGGTAGSRHRILGSGESPAHRGLG